MIDLNRLIDLYNKFNFRILDGAALREDLFLKDNIFEFVKNKFLSENPSSYFPEDRTSIPNIFSPFHYHEVNDWRRIKQKLKRLLRANRKYVLDKTHDSEYRSRLVGGHLIESFYALERSIFWFFNYKYNMNSAHEVSGNQSFYYSQFFVIVAIMRFLGISITYLPFIGAFYTIINWKHASIKITSEKNWSGDHKIIMDNFYKIIKKKDLSDFPEMKQQFQPENSEALFEITGVSIEDVNRNLFNHLKYARTENVYDMTSRISDPFKNFYGRTHESYLNDVKNYCFLDGDDRYYSPPSYEAIDYDEWFYTTFVPDVYGGWGFHERYIGIMLKFLIKILKKVNRAKRYFKILSNKISTFEEFDPETKKIILGWL